MSEKKTAQKSATQPAAKVPAAKKAAKKVVVVELPQDEDAELGAPAEPTEIEPTPQPTEPAPQPTEPAPPAPKWTDEQIEAGKQKFFNGLRNDNVFVDVKLVDLAAVTGMPVRPGINKAVVSEGRIVNVISDSYGLVDNRNYFMRVEEALIDADIYYKTRSTNRDNRSFSVDYILSDDRYHVNIKNGIDKIMPMLSFTNAYDGSGPCTGRFGFFRMVCQNGLHIAKSNIGFKVRHKRDVNEIVIEGINVAVAKFMDNEFYSLHKKFKLLSEAPIVDMHGFVKWTAEKMDLFKFEKGKDDKAPSAKAEGILNAIRKEAAELQSEPNLWLGYNAFNAAIHATGQPFQKQRQLDTTLFEAVLEFAEN